MNERKMSTLSAQTLEQKIGQMVVAQTLGRFRSIEAGEYQALHHLVATFHIGGLKLYHGFALETALLLGRLNESAAIPLLCLVHVFIS